jgi:hypothetical protein
LELYIHPGEKKVLEMAPTSGLMWNLPFDNYEGIINELVPGANISLGADQLDVLFLPGHSPASVGFYSKESGFVVSGDVLFKEFSLLIIISLKAEVNCSNNVCISLLYVHCFTIILIVCVLKNVVVVYLY